VLDKDEIIAIIASEMSNAGNDELVQKKRVATAYYLGIEPAPLDIKGRSSVVSTDCADAIEWLLPNIVESLSGKSVKFCPMSAQDEDQADLETDLTHFVFSEENHGYLNLYEAAKDALLTGVGIFKIYYDATPERVVEHYQGIDENQMQALLADPMIEVTEVERSETDGIAVTAARITRNGKVKVEAVPAEEFRVNDDADSLSLSDARFVAHTTRRTASDLLAMGYDPELIENASHDHLERGDWRDHNTPDVDDSQKQIVVSECYTRMDINEDGIGELVKVTVIGESNPSEILDIEEICEMPFVAMSAIPMPHSFMGMSIFDRLKQVQDVKTAVLRSTLDSFYQSVNRIKVVQEGQVNLDDLLVNRPGGIIRAKGHNAVTELGGTFFGGEALQLLQYADTQKDSRVGVSPDMAGQSNLINNESAHGVERMMSAKEMLVGLMVRSIAETGIRPAYKLVRDLMVRYQDAVTPYKFRGQWMNINPSTWGDRSRMMVTVGTGASDDQQKMGALTQMYQIQQGLMQTDPMNPLVDYSKIFNTIDELSDLSGIGEAEKYLYNPNSPEGQQFGQQKAQQGQQQQQEAMQKEQMQIQMQQAALQAQQKVADAEMQKAQATMANGQLKEQINGMKAQHQAELDRLKTALQAAKDNKQQDFQIQNMKTQAALKLTELEINAKRDLNKDVQDNKDAINGSGSSEGIKERAGSAS
jgi:hypothetical protein